MRERVANTPAPLGPAFVAEYPGIRQAVRLMEGSAVVRRGDQVFTEEMLFTDASMLDLFSFTLLQGTPGEALADLHAIVLTASMAEKYFGTDDPMGQTLQVSLDGQPRAYAVTGVVADPPSHSSLDFDFLMRLEPHPNYQQVGEVWGSSFLSTYVEVADPGLAEEFATRSQAFVEKYFAERIADSREQGWLSPDEDAWQMELQPMQAIHLDPGIRGGQARVSNPLYAYVLSGIALLVLLIACINFVTLSLLRAVDRAREVGVRKVVGAVQGQVVRQFWGEALLMSVLALLLGIGLALFFLPTFNALAAQRLPASSLVTGSMGVGLIGLVLVVGLVAGGYPALVLARHRPVDVLKGRPGAGRRHRWSRALVVVQFTLSTALIASTLIMARQLDFMRTRDLGFAAEQVVVVPMQGGPQEARQVRTVFREEAARRDDILHVSSVNNAFSRGWMSTTLQVDERPVQVYVYFVDYDFVELMGLDLLNGRSFSRDFPADVDSALIVNESLQRVFGGQGAVGERLTFSEAPMPIVGVVRDFHAFSLHRPIEPSVFILSEGQSVWNLLIKIRPDDIPATLAFLEEWWRQVVPDKPFDFVFLDESVQRQYEADVRWGRIVQYAAILAVLIACLGLFGLAALSVTQRTKEIGIRKTLGASARGLVGLLTRQFVAMVLVAAVLAAPLAYFAMQRWLQDFAYHIEMSWQTFLMAGLAALGVALLAVGYHVFRAARVNPADTLRYE